MIVAGCNLHDVRFEQILLDLYGFGRVLHPLAVDGVLKGLQPVYSFTVNR